MGYPEQFQKIREARGLTREQLATRANCHRNTVINIETGRPVRFATILQLLVHLGYRKDSPEARQLALAWLEAVTGIEIAPSEAAALKRQPCAEERTRSRRRLSPEDRDLLEFASRNRKALNALRVLRELEPDGFGSAAT